MATAKQIAARKKFAEMARSGALAKKRKTATKKTVKNPIAPRKTTADKRFMNPKDSFPFKVYRAGVNERPAGAAVGAFKTRSVAVAFANGYAKLHNCAVVLVGD